MIGLLRAVVMVGALTSSVTASTTPSYAQRAWCDRNCISLCNKIFGSRNAGPCIAQYSCQRYQGQPCAPASVVNARYTVYCHNNPGRCQR